MYVLIAAACFLLILVALWTISNHQSSGRGPLAFPIIGYWPLWKKAPHETIRQLIEKYGPLFYINSGKNKFLVVNDIDNAHKLLVEHAEASEGKPSSITSETAGFAHTYDLNACWRKQRAFLMNSLKLTEKQENFSSLAVMVRESELFVERTKKMIEEQKSNVVDLRFELTYFIARLFHRITYDIETDEFDPKTEQSLIDIAHGLKHYSHVTGPLSHFDAFPLLRFLKWEQFSNLSNVIATIAKHCLESSLRTLSNNSRQGCLVTYLKKYLNDMPEKEKSAIALTDDVVYNELNDVMRAGTESTSLTMSWFVLYMASFPKVQEKLRSELKKLPDPFDAKDLLQADYLQAVLTETFRYSALSVFIKRKLRSDVTTLDVKAPKGTTILINTYSIAKDDKHFPEPQKFIPERFLREDGTFNTAMMAHMIPFGAGRRRCVGEVYAKHMLSAAMAAIIKLLAFKMPAGTEADLEGIYGISLQPKSVKVEVEVLK